LSGTGGGVADHHFFDLLKTLVRQPSVVGAEMPFFRNLWRELDERGARVSQYEGLLVAQGNNPESAYLSAHADRHGLVCTGPGEFQYAAFVAGRRSDLLGNSVSERMMTKVASRFGGEAVVAYEPWSGAWLGSGEVTSARISERSRNLVFDVAGLEHLVAGVPIAFADRLMVDDGRVTAQLDNVMTVAALVDLFSHGFGGTAFFSAQEECGRSWRYVLEWFRRFDVRTDRLLVLDTSPFSDAALLAELQVVLRRRDVNAAFNDALADELEVRCREAGVRYVFKDEYIEHQNRQPDADVQSIGSTELGRIVSASSGQVQGTTIQLPTTGYHTSSETATLAAIDGFRRVLFAITGARTSGVP